MSDLVAQNLYTIRKQQSLSLDKLADLSGVSKSMLRQIEKGQSSPTIATLWKIANGLKIPVTTLLREEESDIVEQSFFDGTPILGGSEGFNLHSMIPFDPKRSFEIYHIEIAPGAYLDSDAHNGTPEEYLFVTSGQITVQVDGKQYTVNTENYLRFRANQPHRYENRGTEIAKAINLIAYLA
ncbi:MAG: XRE family transcriptional regulator [Chloroflexota bacterium]